jgi:hypothetical protein
MSPISNDGCPELRSELRILAVAALAAVLMSACDGSQHGGHGDSPVVLPADSFMARIAEHCGKAYEGRIAVNEPEPDDDPFAGQTLVMHVRDCNEDEFRIPFHVGENRSRTWILTRTYDGIRLKHDHRHEDGSEDAVTMYGGETAHRGTAVRQEFPVDRGSVRLFEREGLTASTSNVWAMEIEPGERFVYELARPGTERLFRVEFDLTTPVAEPPPAW